MATQRTKNRAREHSNHKWTVAGWVEGGVSNHTEYKDLVGVRCALMRCDRTQCSWSGWLPVSELSELGIDVVSSFGGKN